MAKYCVLVNPKSGNGRGLANAKKLETLWPDASIRYEDVTALSDVKGFVDAVPEDETLILAGGDGTINHFINSLGGEEPSRDILFWPAGTGNDFMHDLDRKHEDGPFLLNPYLKDLPVVVVNGETSYFLNGIGYGIDGYCCEEGDKVRATSDKPVDYTGIAIKGLLFGFHRTTAEVYVDGRTVTRKHVWLSPCMNGRFFGGGMMCAPLQNRLNPERSVSVMTMHGLSKIKTLIVFPSIFKGEHIKHTEMVDITVGHDVKVKFNRPTPLMIDGETVSGVTEYSVYTIRSPKHPRYAQQPEAATK